MNDTGQPPCAEPAPASAVSPTDGKAASAGEVVAWTADLSVDDPRLDSDHKTLFNLVNGLQAMRLGDGPQDDLAFIVGQLEATLTRHFAAEERYLEEAGYPCLERHRDEHQALVRSFADVKAFISCHQGADAPEHDAIEAILAFLRELTLNHNLKSDLRYRDHLRRGRVMRRPAGSSVQQGGVPARPVCR